MNPKRIARLMQMTGLQAITPGPHPSNPCPGHKIYPYLLRGVGIVRPNHVWSIDITYTPMASGFLYLVAVIDWYSRYVISWELSNSMDSLFFVSASECRVELYTSEAPSQPLNTLPSPPTPAFSAQPTAPPTANFPSPLHTRCSAVFITSKSKTSNINSK